MATSTLQILLQIQNQTGQALQQLQAQLQALQGTLGGVRQASQNTARGMKNLSGSMASTKSELGGLVSGFQALTAALGGLVLIDKLKGIAEGAARAQVLGTVLKEVGKASGRTGREIDALDVSVQKMGITAASSRESLTKMLQAGLDVTQAAKLARAAQNFAVIAGEDSSTTFSRLITNIQQTDTMGLKFMGIVVNMDQVTEKYARTIGKTAGELSQTEKQQALMNEVIKKGAESGAVYVAAMGDVGKSVASLKRLETDYAKTLGDSTLPAWKAMVDEYGTFLRQANLAAQTYDVTGEKAEAFAEVVRTVASALRELTLVLVENARVVTTVLTLFAGFIAFRAVAVTLGFITSALGIGTISWGSYTAAVLAAKTALQGSLFTTVVTSVATTAMSIASATVATVAMGKAFAATALGATALVTASAAVGYAVGSELHDRFESVRIAGAVMVGSIAIRLEQLKGLFKDNAKGVQEEENALYAAIEAIKAATIADEQRALGKAKLVEITEKQIALQPELIAAENAYVAATKTGNALLIADAEAKFNAVKAAEKKLNDERIAELERQRTARRAAMTQAQRDSEDAAAAKIKEAKAYESLADRVDKATGALQEYAKVTPETRNDARRVETMSRAYEKLSGEIKDTISLFFTIDEATSKSKVSVEQLTNGLVRLADGAKTPDDIARAIDSITEAGFRANIDVSQLLSNLKFRGGEEGLKRVNESISGTTKFAKEAVGVMGILSSMLTRQADGARTLADALRASGVSTLDSLKDVSNVGVNALGKVTAGAMLYKDTTLEVSKAVAATAKASMDLASVDYGRADDEIKRNAAAQIAQAKKEITGVAAKQSVIERITKESNISQLENAKKYFDSLASLRDSAIAKVQEYADKIRAIDQETLDLGRSHEEKIRIFKQRGMTDQQKAADNALQLQKLKAQEDVFVANRQFDLAKKLNDERSKLVEAQANASDPKNFLEVSIAESALNTVYKDRLKIQVGLREATVTAQTVQVNSVKAIDTQITELTTKMTNLGKAVLVQVKVELAGSGADGVIKEIQQKLASKPFQISVQANVTSSGGRFREGGVVTGPGSGTSDSVPAWLSAGEFVNTARSVAYYGVDFMRGLNNLSIPRNALKFAAGGLVPSLNSPRYASGGLVAPSGQEVERGTVNINLRVGGEKVSLFGERQQAAKLVTALKRMEFGT